jgi:hypothetical protein
VSQHPLSLQISTRDSVLQKEIQLQYVIQTSHPRWEMLKIFWHAFFHIRFR